MTDGNHPIHPIKSFGEVDYSGISLREYFAAKAMEGILASGVYAQDGNSKYLSDLKGDVKPQCETAVMWADALIEALNEPPAAAPKP